MNSPVSTPPGQAVPPRSEQDPRLDSRVAAGGDGGGGPEGGYPLLGGLAPRPRRRYGWRAVLGCLVVLLASAGAAAVAVIEQVHTIVQDISVNRPFEVSPSALVQSSYGQPETLLLIGNDTRAVFKYYTGGYVPNLANEMLLVRIDPSKPWISMMSLPRELWVTVTEPNGARYTNRLNSAYTAGTTTLLQTIKQVTGLSVNHVIATTFTQFENAINKLGCVYDTVDERYYHNNANGGVQYQNIDLQPGYQCLHGSEAEQFVSYRHTDTSQIRDSRDQSFLLAAKQQYGSQLPGNIGEFEKVFGETVRTDRGLRSSTEVLHLADLLISAKGLRVRQVPFQTTPCDGTTCPAADLTATPQQVQDSVNNFMFGGTTTPSQQVAAFSHKISGRGGLAHLPLTPTLASNVAAERAAVTKLPFTVEFPKVQDLAGSATPVAPQCTQLVQACIRNYVIHAPGGDAYPIYVEVFSNGNLGQFYDVQGTTWTGAPLFANPDQTIRVGRRTYLLFYTGSHLATIAWREYGAVYWVHNTLTDAVGNGELLAIAEQTAPVGAVRNAPTHVILKAFSVPARRLPTVKTPLIESVGRVGGLITLVLLPLGLLVVFRSRRRLRDLRDHVNAPAAGATVLESRLAAVAAGYRPIVAQGAAGYATDQPADARFTGAAPGPYRRYRSRRRWIPASVGLGVGLVVAAAAVYLALGVGALGHKRRPRPQPVPTARVAVVNAGPVPDAAHRLALDLTRQHVHVVATGNLGGPVPPTSYEVLYTPGDRGQARLLAGILKAHHPLVAPIDAATAQAVGSAPKLVVVIP